MSKYVEPSVLGQVLLASVVAGVGLVALFALGLRGLAAAEAGHPSGRVVAAGSFLVVAVGVVLGISTMLAK